MEESIYNLIPQDDGPTGANHTRQPLCVPLPPVQRDRAVHSDAPPFPLLASLLPDLHRTVIIVSTLFRSLISQVPLSLCGRRNNSSEAGKNGVQDLRSVHHIRSGTEGLSQDGDRRHHSPSGCFALWFV